MNSDIRGKFLAALRKLDDAWPSCHDAAMLEEFGRAISRVSLHAAATGSEDFRRLIKHIEATIDIMASRRAPVSRAMAVEIANSLYLLEDALDHGRHSTRIDAAIIRLRRLVDGEDIAPGEPGRIPTRLKAEAFSAFLSLFRESMPSREPAVSRRMLEMLAGVSEEAAFMMNELSGATGKPSPAPAIATSTIAPAPAMTQEAKEVAVPGVVAAGQAEDADRADPDEMLEIYIEEAEGEIGKVHALLQDLLSDDYTEALKTVRRAFHTLKGSGRMVGLMRLGNVAWDMERTLNRQIETGKAPQPALASMIGQAMAVIEQAIAELSAKRTAHVREDILTHRAEELIAFLSGAAIPVAVKAPDPVPEAAPETASESDAKTIAPAQNSIDSADGSGQAADDAEKQGDAMVPAEETPSVAEEPAVVLRGEPDIAVEKWLFDLYLKEMETLASRMYAGMDGLRANGCVTHDMMRAIHTCASNSATAGLDELHDLARGLESVVAPMVDTQEHVSPVMLESIEEAVAGIIGAYEKIGRREVPDGLSGLTNRILEARHAVREEPGTIDLGGMEGHSMFRAPALSTAIDDDRDDDIFPMFLEESEEIILSIPGLLIRWERDNDQEAVKELKRASHTIKGSARMAGMMRFGALMHDLESLLEASHTVGDENLSALRLAVEEGYDLAARLLVGYRSGEHADEVPTDADIVAATLEVKSVRVPLPRLASIDQSATESLLTMSAMEGHLNQSVGSSERIEQSVERMTSLMRELTMHMETQIDAGSRHLRAVGQEGKWDSLEMDRFTRSQELARMVFECGNDLTDGMNELSESIVRVGESLLEQQRHLGNIQHTVQKARLVPMTSIEGRLTRVIRTACRDTGKRAVFDMNTSAEIDSAILERLTAPIEHILRNAVAHGVEMPDERNAAGKREAGTIRLRTSVTGQELTISITDDGRGIDVRRVVEKARRQGLIKEGTDVNDEYAANLVFSPGFSTAEEVSSLAGRGVGLDVVRKAIEAIGGEITLLTKAGQGCTFTLRAPVSVSTLQGVSAASGDHYCVIPNTLIDQIVSVTMDTLTKAYETGMVFIPETGSNHPLLDMAVLVSPNSKAKPEIRRNNTLIILQGDGANHGMALHVQFTSPFRRYVVRHLPAAPQGIMGATIDEMGRIASIINPSLMQRRSLLTTTTVKTVEQRRKPAQIQVMVVDDSVTVRKMTSRMLEREGLGCQLAKDGMEAWEMLHGDSLPDVILLDIEMPRMTGFELTELIRGNTDPAIASLPIIMISSRAGDKHVQHAKSLGVNDYQVKPFNAESLIASIRRLSQPESLQKAA